MIYVLGMSHIGPVVAACSGARAHSQINQFNGKQPPAFVDIDTQAGIANDRVQAASIYLGHVAPHWGPILVDMNAANVLSYVPAYREFLEAIKAEDGKNTLFVFMNGEEYVYMTRRNHAVPYDFTLPSRLDLPILPQRQVVPFDVIRRQVAYLTARGLANFSLIRLVHPSLRVVHVVCPPPVPADYLLDDGLPVPGNAWADDALRLKLYLTYAEYMSEQLARHGIVTLNPPPETVGADGLLLPEYIFNSTHGNTFYGSRVLRQMNHIHRARKA